MRLINLKVQGYKSYSDSKVQCLYLEQLDEEFPEEFFDIAREKLEESSHSRKGSFLIEKNGLKIVCKSYMRGGLPGFFLNDQHMPWSKNRAFLELFWTDFLRGKGFDVPKPLFAIAKQGLFFKRYFYGSELVEYQTDLAASGSVSAAFEAGKVAKRILDLGVQLTDLHPANVLCRANGENIMLDFDKVVTIQEEEDKREEVYLRWRRACLKRGTENLISPFREGLFS